MYNGKVCENGLYGYFLEQAPPVGIQRCPEIFYRRYIDCLSRLFIQKGKSTNAECVLAIGCIIVHTSAAVTYRPDPVDMSEEGLTR